MEEVIKPATTTGITTLIGWAILVLWLAGAGLSLFGWGYSTRNSLPADEKMFSLALFCFVGSIFVLVALQMARLPFEWAISVLKSVRQ